MAKFLKHVGKHGDRKVAVIFRQIPGEEHMCLVVYTELLNQNIHDPLITCIESDQGQASENLGDALNRSYTKDGQIILQMVHREGMMKKVQTSQIVMTPRPNQSVRLNELNTILNEMSKGEDAVRKLADIDASRGLQDPKDVSRRKRERAELNNPAPVTTAQGLLDNSVLANNLRSQAAKMESEARGLMSESSRLLQEAAQLEGVKPSVKKARATKASKAEAVVVHAQVIPEKKPGRSRKNTVTG